MADVLNFKLTDGRTLGKEVPRGEGTGELDLVEKGREPYNGDWIKIKDELISRAAIVSVRLMREGEEGGLLYGHPG